MPCQLLLRYFSCVASHDKHRVTYSRVAHQLRRTREKKGLSMNQVAERAGLSQQMVSYVERGMRNPTLETLLRITEALEVDLADVIKQARKAAIVHSRK